MRVGKGDLWLIRVECIGWLSIKGKILFWRRFIRAIMLLRVFKGFKMVGLLLGKLMGLWN